MRARPIVTQGICCLLSLMCMGLAVAQQAQFDTRPELPANAVQKISAHVYAISGFPNIGIVIGEQASLVIDTGLGPLNGALIANEVKKLAKSSKLYLTTTHFHPEHAALMALGPAHIFGDQGMFVEEDRALFTGDLAMKNIRPRNFVQGSSWQTWIDILDQLAALKPVYVLPDHGEFGDPQLLTE